MDDVLIIIITLVIAVVGALNQKKKREAQKAAGTLQDESGNSADFWDIIEGGEEDLQPPSVVEVEPVHAESEKEKEPVTDVKLEYHFTPSAVGKVVVHKAVKKEKQVRKKVFVQGEEFSLKKAVIYQEILNRKYT